MTRREKQVYDFVRCSLLENGISPSYREIAAYMEVNSTGRVSEIIKKLVANGYLTKIPYSRRSLKLKDSYEELYNKAIKFIEDKGMIEEYMNEV